jgi:hypothetical protein
VPALEPTLMAGLVAPQAAGDTRAIGFSRDQSSYVTLHALQQRPDDASGFGELTFKAQVTVEYWVESK